MAWPRRNPALGEKRAKISSSETLPKNWVLKTLREGEIELSQLLGHIAKLVRENKLVREKSTRSLGSQRKHPIQGLAKVQ